MIRYKFLIINDYHTNLYPTNIYFYYIIIKRIYIYYNNIYIIMI